MDCSGGHRHTAGETQDRRFWGPTGPNTHSETLDGQLCNWVSPPLAGPQTV